MRILIITDRGSDWGKVCGGISWKELGISRVGIVGNQEEVWGFCSHSAPDAVYFDDIFSLAEKYILCQELRERFPKCEIVFGMRSEQESSYRAPVYDPPIQYARVSDDVRDISDSIDAIIKALGRPARELMLESEYLKAILLTGATASVELEKCGTEFCVGCLRLKDYSLLLDAGLEAINFFKRKRLFYLWTTLETESISVFLIGSQGVEIAWGRLFEELWECVRGSQSVGTCFLTFGDCVKKPSEIRQSYDTAMGRQKAIAFMGWDHMQCMECQDGAGEMRDMGEGIVEEFQLAVLKREKKKAEWILKEFCHKLQKHCMYMNHEIRYIWRSLAQIVYRECAKNHIGAAIGKVDMIKEFDSFCAYEEMYRYIEALLDRLFAHGGRDFHYHYVVGQVKDYILDSFSDSSLTIHVLAEYVGMTPNYLSNLFKKYTGMTIGQYIVGIRMSCAKNLLEQSQLKLYQIAERVGYRDENYFAKVFKKEVKMLPSEYRNSHKS